MIKRKHLLEKVKGKRIVIADAGAGYGKTVFLNQIAQHKDKKLWITLREEDASQKIFSQKLTKILSGYFEKDFENLTEALNFLCKARPSLSFFIDDIHNLSQGSSSLLRYFINYSPDSCEFFLAGRGIRKLLGDIVIKEETLILTEKDLSLKLKEVEKLLEINDLEIDFAKRIYNVTKGFPVAVSLIINLLCEKYDFDKVLKEFEEKHLLPFFEFALEKLEPSLKEKLILLSFLPSRIFRKYFSRSDLEKMRKAGLPLTYTEEKPEPHNLLINFIRKHYEDFFKNKRDFYKKIAEKEPLLGKLIVLLTIEDYEEAEKLVETEGFEKFREFLYISDEQLPASALELVENIKKYPHLSVLLGANVIYNPPKYNLPDRENVLNKMIEILTKSLPSIHKEKDFVYNFILRALNLIRNYGKMGKILRTVLETFSEASPYYAEFLRHKALYHLYEENNFEKAKEYITKALEHAEKYSYESNIYDILLHTYYDFLLISGYYGGNQSEYESVIKKALDICNLCDNLKMKAIFLIELADCYFCSGDFKKALIYYQEGLKLGEFLQNEETIYSALGQIFHIYYFTKKFEKLEEILRKIEKLNVIKTNMGFKAAYLSIKGTYLCICGKYREALRYFEETAKIFKETKNESALPGILIFIGSVFRELNKKKEAIDEFSKTYMLAEKIENGQVMADSLLNLAYLGVEKDKNLEKALAIVEKYGLKGNFYVDWLISPQKVKIPLLKYAKEKGIKKNVVEDILKDLPYWNELHVLGKAVLYREGEPVEIKSKRLIELLCFFLCNYGKWISRDSILDEVYFHYGRKDVKKLQGKLRKDLHDLRKIIDPDKKFLQYDPYTGSYKLDFGEDFKVDVIEFKRLAEKGLQYGDEDLLQEAIKLWKGEPFEEYEYLIDFLYFLTWKENLKNLFLKVLYKLCEINFDKGLYEEVLSLCERGSIYEPEDEILQKWRIKALRAQNNFIAANKAQEEFEKLKRKFL